MNSWFNVLKESRLTSQTGIKTKLGTKPLTITDNEDEPSCCEIAIDAYEDVIVEYSYMGKSEDEREWAKSAWERYIDALKTTGSYNTWTVQEHLEHRKGGLNELTCDVLWIILLEDVDHMWGDLVKEVKPKLIQIETDWVECGRERRERE